MKDGGPAFPQILGERYEPMSTEGMSLRDYFAIHASEEDIKAVMFGFSDMSRSKARYIFADAMIAERGREQY